MTQKVKGSTWRLKRSSYSNSYRNDDKFSFYAVQYNCHADAPACISSCSPFHLELFDWKAKDILKAILGEGERLDAYLQKEYNKHARKIR